MSIFIVLIMDVKSETRNKFIEMIGFILLLAAFKFKFNRNENPVEYIYIYTHTLVRSNKKPILSKQNYTMIKNKQIAAG